MDAARIDDAVGHKEIFFGSVVGFAAAAVGIVVCAFLVIGGILAAPVSFGTSTAATVAGVIGLLAICEAGAGVGSLVAEFFPPTPTGKIKEGARTVFVGPANKAASRVDDAIECMDTTLTGVAIAIVMQLINPSMVPVAAAFVGPHVGSKISEGSLFVRVEGKFFSRVGDKTQCEGEVSAGEPTVMVLGEAGGPGRAPIIGWIPWAWSWGLSGIEWASFYVSGPKKLVKMFLEEGLSFGLKRLGREELKALRKSKWPAKVLKVWGYHDLAAPVLEDVVEYSLGADSVASKTYNGINDSKPQVLEFNRLQRAVRLAKRKLSK